MHKTIRLQMADGTEKDIEFKACGTTSLRYRAVFGKELMKSVASIIGVLDIEKLKDFQKLQEKAKKEGKDDITVEDLDPVTVQMIISIAGAGEMEAISQLAYIMNKQAERADMTSLDIDGYLDWLDQFESLAFMAHAMDFLGLYMGNKSTSAEAKKKND